MKHISLAIKSLDGQDWKIGCIVANVGGSKATIIETHLTISRDIVESLESFLIGIPNYDRKYSFGSFSIEPGERQERTEGKEQLTTVPIVCFGFSGIETKEALHDLRDSDRYGTGSI